MGAGNRIHKKMIALGFEPRRLSSSDLKSAALDQTLPHDLHPTGFEPATLAGADLDTAALTTRPRMLVADIPAANHKRVCVRPSAGEIGRAHV